MPRRVKEPATETIKISKKARRLLNKLKILPEESYNSIIMRLLKFYKEKTADEKTEKEILAEK